MPRLRWAANAVSTADTASPRAEVVRLAGLREIHSAFDWFSARVRALADTQLEVTRIPAPPFGESQRAAWFRERFLELGLEEVHTDQAGNVLGIRLGTAPEAGFVALTAHMDTVFPEGTPLDIRREGERLLGPGISDNSSGLVALLAVAGALQAAQIQTAAPILFLANVGEEGEGDLRGMRHIFNDSRWRESIAYTLVLDVGGTDTIVTAGLGSRRFQATMRGPGGHSWTDFGTPNPIVALARAIQLFSRTPIPPERETSFNVGVIAGGTSVNSIPETASMRVDVRSTSPSELDRVEKALRAALAQAAAEAKSNGIEALKGNGLACELKIIGNRPAAELASDSRLLQTLRAVDAQLGIRSRLQCASTDANIPLAFGCEAVAIGTGGCGGGAHTMREWYDPLNRELGLRRILLTVLALAEVPQTELFRSS